MVVSKKSMMVFFSLLIMIMPEYFSNMIPGYRVLMNFVSVLIVVYLFKHCVRPSRFMWCVITFYIITLFSTFFNGKFDYHDLISQLKIIITLMLVEDYLKSKRFDGINVIYYIIAFYVFIDICSVMLFPDGLYQSTTVWNEWYSSSASQWILGNKNNHIMWYLLVILLSYIKYIGKKNIFNKLLVYLTLIGCEVSALILQSSTSMVVILIVAIGIIIALFERWSNFHIVNMHTLNVIYCILMILVMLGMTQFLSPIVEGVFDKNLTFSNRTYAWAQSIVQIRQKPILGWGIISSDEARVALGNMAYVYAHNQWLQTLWQGGIVLLIVLILAVIVISIKVNRLNNSNLRVVMMLVLFSYLIEMIFEVQLRSTISWMIFLIIYNAHLFDQKERIKYEDCFN